MSEDKIDEKKKKKKKSSGKKDACYHKVKRRYKVWPSAYASGALVKCRKAGAKNWGNKSKKNEQIELVEEKAKLTPESIEKVFRDEGGASGMDPFLKAIDASEEEIKNLLKNMENVGLHEEGDYILEDGKEIRIVKGGLHETNKEAEALQEKEGLRKWFGRKGAKGSKSGWVDCNAPDGKGGYKACGRSSGEKRKRYPACRPTPSACKSKGKGKSWGKKGKSRKSRKENILRQVESTQGPEASDGQGLSEGLTFHIGNNVPLCNNIYRHGSSRYFDLVNEARELWTEGKIKLCEEDVEIMESDLGTFVEYRGEQVPLDFPMRLEEKKKKKDPPIGKPTKNTGSGKKYKVFVRNPKTGRIKKITYGDSKGGLKGNWNNAEARKSFAARHNCAEKKDRMKAGYWACRAHKDFGTNVPGRFW